MTNNFFRKDLNLNNRWWHRLLLIIYFLSVAWVLYEGAGLLFFTPDNSYNPYIPQWKEVGSVDERITVNVKQIHELKKMNERVEERGLSFRLNSGTNDLQDNLYCSNDLENRVGDIQNKSGVNTLYIRHIYDRNSVPIETFIKYIKDNNTKCLIADAYTYSAAVRQEFLEPVRLSSYKNLVFYKKSTLFTLFFIVKQLLTYFAIFAGIVIVYYKIILYIIFGSKK